MKYSLSRRSLLLAGVTLPLAGLVYPAWSSASSPAQDKPLAELYKKLAELENSAKGRLGVALINTANSHEIQYRGGEFFPFCSTFKLMLVAAVLHQSMFQLALLEKHIAYTDADLLSYAPITRQNLKQGMSVSQLCAATMMYSDNTAANLLLEELGGIEVVNNFARGIGDQAFHLDRLEPELNTAVPGDRRDTTTPAAMAASVQKVMLADVLAPPQRKQLVAWFKGNTTGDASIRAGAPVGWVVGDKTGAGGYGTTNDVAVLWPTAGSPVILAIYFTQQQKDAEPRRDILASATRLVMEYLSRNS